MREFELVGGCHFSGVGLLGEVNFLLPLKRGMFCMHFSLHKGMSSWKTFLLIFNFVLWVIFFLPG